MDNFGFIHEELDLKILILFILKRLCGPIDSDSLWDIARTDSGFTYFDYADSLNDLVESGNVNKSLAGYYAVSLKGRKNAETVENGLPYSVRSKIDALLPKINDRIMRDSLILADIEEVDGLYRINMGMSDGKGELFRLSMICTSEVQAQKAIKRYRKNPDAFFGELTGLVLDGE